MASLHFNENLLREPQKTKDGKDYLLVTYPKYKFGEEVVQEVRHSAEKLYFLFTCRRPHSTPVVDSICMHMCARSPEPRG